jgi:hypothetical protein
MARRGAIALVLCFCFMLVHAQQRSTSLINYGVKGGFSSTLYEVQNLTISGMPINSFTTKSEISSFYTIFARINAKRHYVQTECSYNVSNYTIDFASTQWSPSAQPYDKSTIGTKIIGLEVPLYYGYHIMQEGPYGMSFYLGPKAKFILTDYSRHSFKNVPYEFISERVKPINFSLMMGIGINIARVFFDFSFEYGLHNISNGFTTIDLQGNESTQGIIFDRRKNVLSFSIGFIF